MKEVKTILQIGTVNWQTPKEPAPGSGILHEAHHRAFHDIGIKSFSVFPTRIKRKEEPFISPIYLEHDIPIFTRIPTSSYRFSDMSDSEFSQYIDQLVLHLRNYIDTIEKGGTIIDATICHHVFINPLIMTRINEERIRQQKLQIPVFAIAHGTELKFYEDKNNIKKLKIIKEIINKINGIFTISRDQQERFKHTFSAYPSEKVVISNNGVDPQIFKPLSNIDRKQVLANLGISTNADYIVTFVGKFAEWKRLDYLLCAASIYEKYFRDIKKNIITIIAGTGSPDQIELYRELADSLNLENTYFVGPQVHTNLAQIYNISDVGVFPSLNEPFGLVFLECMACKTPVIGANSGGPRDFITTEVGKLINEGHKEEMINELSSTIISACMENWKKTKGNKAYDMIYAHYTWNNQILQMLSFIKNNI